MKKKVKLFFMFVMSVSTILILSPVSFADTGGAIEQGSSISFYEEKEATKGSSSIKDNKVDSKLDLSVDKPLPQTGDDNSILFVIVGCILLFILVCSLEIKWRKKDV